MGFTYKSCYVVNFFLGNRRHEIEEKKEDNFFYLKKQIEYLENIKNNLNKIVFNFNIRPEDYHLIGEIFSIVPKKINNTIVELNFRKNYGMSYGAFSDIYFKNMDLYDYFIFNEDDYLFVEDEWDTYLINKFNSFEDCGYLCMLKKNINDLNKGHAAHSTGISSNKVLKKIYEKYGELPHSKNNEYLDVENKGQIKQTSSVLELGYNIYDIRDDYRLYFYHPQNASHYNIYFPWNEKEIIVPIQKIKSDEIYFYIDFLEEFWMCQDNKNDEIKFKIMNNSNEDLNFLLEIRNHPTTREQLENNQVFSLEQCKEWYFSLKTPWYIIYYNNIKVGYFRRNLDEIGCDIHPKYRNLGIAKKVYLKYLKNVNFASLWVFDDNFAKKIYEKVGFKEIKEFKIIRDRKYVKMIYNSENNE